MDRVPFGRLWPRVCVFVSSARKNHLHRSAIRNTWMRFVNPATDDASGPEAGALSARDRARVTVRFVVSRKSTDDGDNEDASLAAEAQKHGDLFLAETPEGYDRLWAKALEYLHHELEHEDKEEHGPIAYFFHADDDSYVRLDLLMLQVLFPPSSSQQPNRRLYWGYVWNSPESNPGARTTPIRDPTNKSHMPEAHYPFETYPAFCSGCGFALSRDLAMALVRGAVSGAVQKEYRVLDPPFGVYLCGPPPPEGRGIFGRGRQGGGGGGGGRADCSPDAVVPVHDARVRPYRALPLFDASTIVQHYLRPEELRPFHGKVLEALRGEEKEEESGGAPARLYEQLVGMGLLRR